MRNPNRSWNQRGREGCWAGVVASGTLAALLLGGSANAQVPDGFADLSARLGSAMPTGSGIGLGQVEAGGTNGDVYAPNAGSFPNQTITLISGASSVSGHANMVLSTYLGRSPGSSLVWSWEALDWLQGGFLNFGAGAPLLPPIGYWDWRCSLLPSEGLAIGAIPGARVMLNPSELALLQRLTRPAPPRRRDGQLMGPEAVWLHLLDLVEAWCGEHLGQRPRAFRLLRTACDAMPSQPSAPA